jgi:DNA-binding transcriptional regulator GbsR (MarR family)
MATTRLNKVANKLVSDLFAPREFDENAETVEEISQRIGASAKTISGQIRKMVLEGKIERVWKRGTKNPIPAYRIK